MKKIRLLIILLVSIICITGCGAKDDSSKYNINIDADENIEVKTYIDYEKEYLIVYMTNNNTYNIGAFDVEAIYYDSEGNKIGEDSDTCLDFVSGGKYISALDLPYTQMPDKIELSVKIDQEFQNVVGGGTLYNDKVSTNYKKINDEEIEVTITNNSGVELSSVEVAILFIKNGKPIYMDSLSSYLETGRSASEIIDVPEDWEASEKSDHDVFIDYDSIEIVVIRASNW